MQQDNRHWSGIPEFIKNLLIKATNEWEDETNSETIEKAIDISGRDIKILVGAYRYFFYKHNFHRAREIAEEILEKSEHGEHFNIGMDEEEFLFLVSPRTEEAKIRLYLNTASALALVYGKLGLPEKAMAIVSKISLLEKGGEFGANAVKRILESKDD